MERGCPYFLDSLFGLAENGSYVELEPKQSTATALQREHGRGVEHISLVFDREKKIPISACQALLLPFFFRTGI